MIGVHRHLPYCSGVTLLNLEWDWEVEYRNNAERCLKWGSWIRLHCDRSQEIFLCSQSTKESGCMLPIDSLLMTCLLECKFF